MEDFQKKYNLIDPFTDIKNIESRKYQTQNEIKEFKKNIAKLEKIRKDLKLNKIETSGFTETFGDLCVQLEMNLHELTPLVGSICQSGLGKIISVITSSTIYQGTINISLYALISKLSISLVDPHFTAAAKRHSSFIFSVSLDMFPNKSIKHAEKNAEKSVSTSPIL